MKQVDSSGQLEAALGTTEDGDNGDKNYAGSADDELGQDDLPA